MSNRTASSSSTSASALLPGRLGTPDMAIGTDPRADPRMVLAMEPLELHREPEPVPVSPDDGIEAVLGFCDVAEPMFQELLGGLFHSLPPVAGVEHEELTLTGVDGNEIRLFIHRPRGHATGDGDRLPGIVHIHGGGMAIMTATEPQYRRWRDELAATGLIVVGVEFRNAAGMLGANPFPAGLNDCSVALRWVGENKAELGISTLVVSGESGGGNLSLASTLKAKRDGHLDAIDGVYAQCPYISGMYGQAPPELTSLHENSGYFLGNDLMAVMVRSYSPDGSADTDPLAWPYHATVDDLSGLPPHVISVNQLDPLRDEGLAYYRRLLEAGVSAVGRTVNGTCHAGDCIFREALPDVYLSTVRDINAFAYSL